jgi:hypothetical protein
MGGSSSVALGAVSISAAADLMFWVSPQPTKPKAIQSSKDVIGRAMRVSVCEAEAIAVAKHAGSVPHCSSPR